MKRNEDGIDEKRRGLGISHEERLVDKDEVHENHVAAQYCFCTLTSFQNPSLTLDIIFIYDEIVKCRRPGQREQLKVDQ